MSEDKPLYKVKVNGFEFSFSAEQLKSADLIRNSATAFHLLHNSRSINATLIQSDLLAKQQTIEIDGQHFDIQIKDELDMMLDDMGFSSAVTRQIKEIKAPMPGLVLEVAVGDGQQVQQGDKLLILVAMKMENSIIMSSNATIKRVVVSAGQAVEKGQVLIELE